MPEKPPNDAVHKLVEKSGIPFQTAIAELIRADRALGWEILDEEYPWRHRDTDGSTDIVLTRGNLFLVVECKKMFRRELVFFVPGIDAKPQRRLRVRRVVLGVPGFDGWEDQNFTPESVESTFCELSGEGRVETLESIARPLLRGIDSLVRDIRFVAGALYENHSAYFVGAIVTNAPLRVFRFNPGSVDLSTGTAVESRFEDVGLVRFRRSLDLSGVVLKSVATLKRHTAQFERGVFVINSASLPDTLKALSRAL